MDWEKHPILCICSFIHGYALFLAAFRGDYWIPGAFVLPFCGIRDEEVRDVGSVLEAPVSILG